MIEGHSPFQSTKAAGAMERSRFMSWVRKRDNLIHLFLVGSFVALSVRSVSQQQDIEALQAQKEALQKQNKSAKKTLWDSKQALFDEASNNDTFPVSLSRLKVIYGETSLSKQGQAGEATAESASITPKFVV